MIKGEIACNKQFLLFSQCFLPYMVLIFHFKCTLKCHLQFISIWTSLMGKELITGINYAPWRNKLFVWNIILYCEGLFSHQFQHFTLKCDPNLGLIWANVRNGKFTHDGEQLCLITIKSISKCRSYAPDMAGRKLVWTDAGWSERQCQNQSPKNPCIRSSLLGKTWSGQVDYPSLSNCRTSAKWQADE